ncbi:MAG TPA: DHA2 family efflux MFS transporter permease subunit [Gaiellaceae bacterium]|nr:DHA2 family efflux MFS transporter permease subunit [Gaiellaceae bacterium]
MTGTPDPRRWQALTLVCVAFFMTILDVSIVNVALPSIKTSLGVSDTSLQWVLVAYAITFGGFLLLGGRAADLIGRRRLFMAGLALFSLASLVCGLAGSIGVLVAARTVQGLGAAIISPATLSIITTTFEEGSERNKALGIWGAMGGSGAAAGVLFGGILTKYAGWEWIFFVNVPVGALVLALTRPIVRESRVPGLRGFDAAGAATVTSGLALLVYAISKAPDVGWSSGRTIGLLLGAAFLLVAFLAIEARQSSPMVPFSIFRTKTLAGANAAGFLLGAVVYADFFILTLYVQQVLGYSALKTGLTFLATAGTVIPVAGASQALVTRIGVRPVLTIGLALIAAAMVWYAQIPVHGRFAGDLLPPYLLMGIGMAFAFIPVSIAALAGVEAREAGLASGLINTSQQIGGALGVAIASTVAFTHVKTLLASGHSQPEAMTSGFALAFWVLAALAAASVVVSAAFVRSSEVAVEAEEAVAFT